MLINFLNPIGHKRIQSRCDDYNSMESVIKTTRTSFVRDSKIWECEHVLREDMNFGILHVTNLINKTIN